MRRSLLFLLLVARHPTGSLGAACRQSTSPQAMKRTPGTSRLTCRSHAHSASHRHGRSRSRLETAHRCKIGLSIGFRVPASRPDANTGWRATTRPPGRAWQGCDRARPGGEHIVRDEEQQRIELLVDGRLSAALSIRRIRGQPCGWTRVRAAEIISGLSSTPTTCPAGPTALSRKGKLAPELQPASSTGPPGTSPRSRIASRRIGKV